MRAPRRIERAAERTGDTGTKSPRPMPLPKPASVQGEPEGSGPPK